MGALNADTPSLKLLQRAGEADRFQSLNPVYQSSDFRELFGKGSAAIV